VAWSLECDTTGDGTFNDTLSQILLIQNDASMAESFSIGYFNPKRTNYANDDSTDILFAHKHTNKTFSVTLFTNFDGILKLTYWHMLACDSDTWDGYNYYSNPAGVVRILKDSNTLAIVDHIYAFAIITDITFINRVGDTERIVADVTFKTLRYK